MAIHYFCSDNQAHGFAVQEIVFSPDESFTLRLDSNHQVSI